MMYGKMFFSGVQENESAREDVEVLVNDVCYSAVVEFECVSYILL